MQKVISWERKFQVWQYSVSHSVLLLRSFHPQKYTTRIDVAFPAVTLMHLQPSYETLSVRQATEEERLRILGATAEKITHGNLFLLNEGEGYVHAADFSWHEDSGDHHTPSSFGPLRGTA
ncbi:hypothetical protein [Streptomyces caatingaensis]|uniref:hypothetical protein n=1 Tax=Streptomyces caatingaensis TaxID=1678637 RepID=UPI000A7B1BF8|nr:hypothetical protein [Streptomyces caatingaensis]